MARTNITMKFELPVTFKKKAKWYVAYCPILDTYSQGETEEKAKNNLIETLKLFFISCIERNILDTVMKECGFSLLEKRVEKREEKLPKKSFKTINVPISLPSTECLRECHP